MKTAQKKAIIIGATSGIGLEMVRVLTAQGWQVGIAGRRQERLQQIQSKNLDVVATECIDITKEDAPRHLLTLIGKTGGMDLYFHSAGVGYQNPSLNIEKEMTTVATNVTGFTQMVDTAFHYFMEHPDREAHLAVISSIAGTRGLGAAPAYSSTKRYINHYLECLTQLCHIRGIHHIQPPSFPTDITTLSNSTRTESLSPLPRASVPTTPSSPSTGAIASSSSSGASCPDGCG